MEDNLWFFSFKSLTVFASLPSFVITSVAPLPSSFWVTSVVVPFFFVITRLFPIYSFSVLPVESSITSFLPFSVNVVVVFLNLVASS